MRELNYVSLGATLFIPATHKALFDVVCNEKYPQLKSVVIDTEDALNDEDLQNAFKKIETLLERYEQKKLFVFIRPRNMQTLSRLLKYKNIKKVDGFVLAKFSLDNAQKYLSLLKDKEFHIMPSIEGKELFEQEKLHQLKECLLPFKHKIPLVRFGLEDMLKELGMRRSTTESIFDYAAPSFVLGQFIAVFKSAAFPISGGVFPFFTDDEAFKQDLRRDLKEGLFGKTIIHPQQIQLAHNLYKVKEEEYKEAMEILQSKESVFNQNSKMAETKTMAVFAKEILLRKEVYGLVK
jgi:citrate lyase beta subunit